MLLFTSATVGLLWVATVLASDSSWQLITLFWVVVGGGLALWTWRAARADARHIQAQVQMLESARSRDEAEVFDISARAFIEFQEVEDEGACYAFDLGDDTIVFVVGQQFYPGARFPSLDFSLVYPLAENGESADELIEKRGARAAPMRVIPRAAKLQLDIPEHLAVVHGSLERLEETLTSVI
jgi:hypothetical protein